MIPDRDKVIQGLWVEGELSVMEELCIRSFLVRGHEFHLYTYGDVPNVPDGTKVKSGQDILPEDRIFRYEEGFGKGGLSGFANLFRLHLLHDRGGWWVDMDVVCLRAFEFNRSRVIGTSWEPGPSEVARANNCVLRADPEDPFIKYCLDICENIDMSQIRFGETGPDLIKRAVAELGLKDDLVSWDVFCPIGYRDVKLLTVPWYHLLLDGRIKPALRGRPQVRITREARAIHLWNEMWRYNGLNKHDIYPHTSMIEQLKRRFL